MNLLNVSWHRCCKVPGKSNIRAVRLECALRIAHEDVISRRPKEGKINGRMLEETGVAHVKSEHIGTIAKLWTIHCYFLQSW